MRRIFYSGLILTSILFIGCDKDNKAKELELKERELELKEKELKIAEKAEKQAQKAESNSEADFATKKTIEKENNYGVITGNKVIIRSNHTTKSNNMGNYVKGERVEILDEYYPANNTEAIAKKQIYLYNDYGRFLYTLVPGKAVEILEETHGEYWVSFDHPEYGKLTATVNGSDLDFISGDKWYKVRRNNGQTGWVFSKFLKR
ncbi:SH3 domain-containing protein [Weeksellaceae bacterium KMM 9724]|uniref:SH3 domain-containing protein n=1 Tax=Profundicola chukchiensis TaxID=2961959 RepID=UPI00243E7252|nr:SH3 domain-containing protein [Profundicola chukchiensis]MDG4950769.1 SH3 domain-containing protein [Profundicola chukchiensis]